MGTMLTRREKFVYCSAQITCVSGERVDNVVDEGPTLNSTGKKLSAAEHARIFIPGLPLTSRETSAK